MRLRRTGFSALVTRLTTISILFSSNFSALLSPLQALAQTPNAPSNQNRKWLEMRGIPGNREAGAQRGGCSSVSENTLTALMPPTSGGLTIVAYPTFFFYVPPSSAMTAELVVWEEKGHKLYEKKLSLTGSSGIISLSLPATKALPPLEIGKNYRWRFSMLCNREDRSVDLHVDGWIQRVEPSPALLKTLEKAAPRQHPAIYAAHGIWYDTLTTLAELRRSVPNDSTLINEWMKLLESVGLPDRIAKAPFRLQVQAKTPDPQKTEANALLQQGSRQYRTSQFKAALESWQQSLTIYRELQDRELEGKTLNNLGLIYYSLGDLTRAIASYQQSLAIAQQLQDRRTEGRVLGNLGLTYAAIGNYTKAIDYYQQSLAIAKDIKDRYGEGQVLGELGSAYFFLGNYAKAITIQQQRLGIAKDIKDRLGEGATLNQLGLAYYATGDLTQAIEFYQQSSTIARAIQNPRAEGQALGNLGLAYLALGNNSQALEVLQQSLTIMQTIQDRPGEGAALNNLGLALFESGKLAAATKTLRVGIQVWESLRERLGNNDANKVSIFETQVNSYPLLQGVLIAQNDINSALEIAERGRARAFVELLATRLGSDRTAQYSITPPTLSQIQQIAKVQNVTLVEYSIIPDDFEIQGKLQVCESELFVWVIKPTGEVAFRRVDLKPLWQKQNKSLKDLVTKARESVTQGVSSRGTSNKLTFSPGALVRLNDDEPNWTPWQVVAVNAQSGTLKLKQPSFKEGVTIERSQADVVEKVTPSYTKNPHLQQLHQLLIRPIADLLPTDTSSRVIFIPQDSLFLVPFPALQDANGKYLIEQHTIATAPAIQVLNLTHQQKQRVSGLGKNALVVGNPTMPKVSLVPGQKPQQLESLPHAEQEAIDIAQMLQAKAITGSQASEADIVQQLPKAGLIHLATHGILDEIRGLGSAIALAPSGTDDGLLTAEEILDLQLQAELVVLSACDTGQGRITGDGIIGLSRSLFAAGVPSVIVSLWSVPDAPTAPLMKEFYQQLQSSPDKAQALRNAMLKTMKKYPEPRDWAAFTLIGEAN